jgi:hypothetical protein
MYRLSNMTLKQPWIWHHVTNTFLRDVTRCIMATVVESSWNAMAHSDAREGKWSGNWRMEWVASTLHTTSQHGVSGITTADAHTSAAGSRLNWSHRRLKWTRPLRRKTKSGFCACAITFQMRSTFRLQKVTVSVCGTKWLSYPDREMSI